MGRSTVLLLVVATAVVGWFVLQRYEIRGFKNLKFVRRDGTSLGADGLATREGNKEVIRIASFNLESFGPAKVENMAVMEVLARVIREFDIVALQEVRSARPDVLRSLMDHVNETGRNYSILVGPQVGRDSDKEQFVFVFDQARIETDRAAAYTVDDPDDLLRRPPLVGWFRVRGADPEKAFTFTLVNVHTDPDDADLETRHLDAVFYAVRDDDRGEDDLIMLGDFSRDDQHLGELASIPSFLAAIATTPTNTAQTEQVDNVVFQLSATTEYAGRSGVFDFMRKYNLTLEQALQVSDHLPVWAEFSVQEGGHNPAVATVQGNAPMR